MDQNTSWYTPHGMTQALLTLRVSPWLGKPNWAPALCSHDALHSIFHVPWNRHGNSWSLAHLTAQPSPACKAPLSFRNSSSAGTRCVSGNNLMKSRHLPHHCPLKFLISMQHSPQIPVHLAFQNSHFPQLEECLCSRPHTASHLVPRDMHLTCHNTKERILSSRARLPLPALQELLDEKGKSLPLEAESLFFTCWSRLPFPKRLYWSLLFYN